MDNRNDIRIAWLFPSLVLGNYWHPVLSYFTQTFKNTIVYTGNWPGFTPGYEGSFTVKLVGKTKRIETNQSSLGYNPGFDFVSPAIIGRLLQFKPHVIFTSAFSIWSLLAVLLKPLGGWQIVVIYDGSSPTIDASHSKLRSLWRRLITKLTNAFITNTEQGKLYLTNTLKANEKLVFTKPYEVPDIKALSTRLVKVEQINLKWKKPSFLFVGQIIHRKGIHFLLDACLILQSQGYSDYTLAIVGDGNQKKELEDFTRKHGLQNCVQWLGWVDYASLSNYFQLTDVFVFPTLEDVWGMVVLEAMTFGQPILCSKWAGACEMVSDGQNGYIFDPYAPENLANLMKHFIDNPSLITSMGLSSQQIIAQHTPEAAANFLTEVVNVVLKTSKNLNAEYNSSLITASAPQNHTDGQKLKAKL